MIGLTRRSLSEELDQKLSERAARLRQHLADGEEPSQALLNFYRDPELKGALVAEAHGKCMYCESKISHVYFGDVEHIKPKSVHPEKRLDHDNLGLACAVCNNAKGEFWDEDTPLLNPYVDDPDQELIALGCMVVRRPGRSRARLTIERVQLNRVALLERRKERIDLLASLADQYIQAPPGAIKQLLKDELCRDAAEDSEYALVIRAYLAATCNLQCAETT